MGLGICVPEAELLLLDGQEVAAIAFLPVDYKNMNKWKKVPDANLPSVFQHYLDNGLLFKWAVLDYLLGSADVHAGNVMMNRKQDVKLIDHGSSFAGFSFNPGKDSKSFIPYYLRVFTHRKFNALSPDERMKYMPILGKYNSEVLKHWIDAIPDGQIVEILNHYGIHAGPFVKRLQDLRDYPGPKYEFLNKFFSGEDMYYGT